MTCNTHLQTCPSYFSQKSGVKIWFGLVEPFKSYRGKTRGGGGGGITDATENNKNSFLAGNK